MKINDYSQNFKLNDLNKAVECLKELIPLDHDADEDDTIAVLNHEIDGTVIISENEVTAYDGPALDISKLYPNGPYWFLNLNPLYLDDNILVSKQGLVNTITYLKLNRMLEIIFQDIYLAGYESCRKKLSIPVVGSRPDAKFHFKDLSVEDIKNILDDMKTSTTNPKNALILSDFQKLLWRVLFSQPDLKEDTTTEPLNS